MTWICGVEEAGRGPLIGPLVMAVAWTDDEAAVRAAGARDSKQLTLERREAVYAAIIDLIGFAIVEISPKEIDAAVTSREDNLNRLEARATARLLEQALDERPIARAYLDAPQTSTAKYEALVRASSTRLGKCTIIAENKADERYPIVGAASILAKVTRDRRIRELEAEAGEPIGTGYPSDPATQIFLRKHWKNEKFQSWFRKSWAPYRAQALGRQETLSDFDRDARAERFRPLTRHGFTYVPTTNPYEVARLQGPGATVIAYTTGKVLVQGRAKPETEALLRRHKI